MNSVVNSIMNMDRELKWEDFDWLEQRFSAAIIAL
jgi:hypothetical protein